MGHFSEVLDAFIKGAQRLSELNPGAIWALLALVEFVLLFLIVRRLFKDQKVALEVRLADAEASREMADAVEKLADEVRRIAEKREVTHD